MRAVVAAAFALLFQQEPNETRARVTAEKLAGCVKLYEDFTGREAKSLDELVKPPAGTAFWPEGGFHLGTLPEGYRIEKRRVVHAKGSAGVSLDPPARAPIVPPTDKLKKQFAARVKIELLRLEGEAYLARTGGVPTKREDLGPVPADCEIRFMKACLIIRADGSIDPTLDERASLEKTSVVEPTAEDRRAIAAALDRMADDDLEVREEAERELVARGPFARSQLQERLTAAKDADVRRWLAKAAARIPEMRPTWRAYAGSLSAFVQTPAHAAKVQRCANNLSQLCKMQYNYVAQFGGADKLFPRETGGDFWLALARTIPPLIDMTLAGGPNSIYACPAAAKAPEAEKTSYRGPAKDANTYGDGDPIGACDDEGHGGLVIVLRKSSDVLVVTRDDPLYKQALERTKK